MAGFPTLKGSWPWPWIRSYCIPPCITHQPLPTCQISFKSKKLFVDGRTYGQTYGHLRLALIGRLSRVDLIMYAFLCCKVVTFDRMQRRKPLSTVWMTNEQSVSIGNNFLHKHLLVISISEWTYMSTSAIITIRTHIGTLSKKPVSSLVC